MGCFILCYTKRLIEFDTHFLIPSKYLVIHRTGTYIVIIENFILLVTCCKTM